jgi:hypothetical protein
MMPRPGRKNSCPGLLLFCRILYFGHFFLPASAGSTLSPSTAINKKNRFKSLIGKEMPMPEESQAYQLMTSQLLTKAGILVDIAGNRQAAPTSLQARIYDTIPVDVMTPKTNGPAATEISTDPAA